MIFKDNYLKELAQPSTVVGATLAGLTSGLAIATSGSLSSPTSLLGKIKDFTKLQKKNFFVNITMVMFNLFRYYFFNPLGVQPAAVIGGMPLPSIQEISHAISERFLNYRATGGIFLAHQEGGEQSLRIQGKSFGLNRYMFLAMLDLLFLYGSSRVVDQFSDVIQGVANLNSENLHYPGLAELPPAAVDPWKKVEIYNLDEGKDEAHLTFPIITKTKVYTNMYIETYEFTESVENGMNCLTYSIFFRKYLPKYPYKFQEVLDEYGNSVYYYTSDEKNDVVKSIRRIDTMMDIGYSSAMIMYRFLQYYEGNSPEHNIAHITGINLSNQYYGRDYTDILLRNIDENLDYNLSELSVPQKAELMNIG
ncbi:MAG: hypothetical protein V3V14_08365 [Saprospiraceae bacterium]